VRLAAAFERVASLPAHGEARRALLEASGAPSASMAEVTEAVESDPALAIAVLRAANNGGGRAGRCASLATAVAALTPSGVASVAEGVAGYDVLASPPESVRGSERFRRHALAVRDTAERIARLAGRDAGGDLAAAALLHDVGRLVLIGLDPRFEASVEPDAGPEARVRAERDRFGIDHALAGAVLVRRWRLPPALAAAVERHHADDARGTAAIVRLADLVVHHAAGAEAIDGQAMLAAAAALEIDEPGLRTLLYEYPGWRGRRAPSEPSPLSAREIEVVRGLAAGKVQKQIARELALSVSTVRTHLHNVYRKLGAVDRAQAVLIARDNGWI
jgi:putative nucleotidyltransferase with HDIG domain